MCKEYYMAVLYQSFFMGNFVMLMCYVGAGLSFMLIVLFVCGKHVMISAFCSFLGCFFHDIHGKRCYQSWHILQNCE